MSSPAVHIVVLEDNPADLYMIQYSIREAGIECEFTAFEDGAEVLKFMQTDASPVPDLMILDGHVPGTDGATVLNGVGANSRGWGVGVSMSTGSQAPQDVARGGKLGADRYLIKP